MRKLAAYTLVRLASALSWKPPAHRVRELFPATADATARNADPHAVYVVTGASGTGFRRAYRFTCTTLSYPGKFRCMFIPGTRACRLPIKIGSIILWNTA